MAWETINVGDQKNVSLELSVDTYTKEEFRKLHLPAGMSFPVERESIIGGCLGILLTLIINILLTVICAFLLGVIGGICVFLFDLK